MSARHAPASRAHSPARALAAATLISAFGLVAIASMPGPRIVFRNALVTVRGDTSLLTSEPKRLGERGVRFETRERSDSLWRVLASADSTFASLRSVIAAMESAADRAEALAAAMVVPDAYAPCLTGDLTAKALRILGGGGCCSDHTEVYLALAPALGITALEVQSANHGFVMYWAADRGQWQVLDVQFGLAIDAPGGAASLHREFVDGPAGQVRPAGIKDQLRPVQRVAIGLYYSRAELFESLTLTLGSDVIAQDLFLRRLGPVPRALSHFVAHLVGNRPGYAVIRLDGSVSRGVALRRVSSWTLLLSPLLLMSGAIGARRRG